jgi:hypothetical protein
MREEKIGIRKSENKKEKAQLTSMRHLADGMHIVHARCIFENM